ncbi:MAG: flagellar motor protein MotB [Alphaproteobacteria bacterium]|nr:flagellar motor protein MotB [Alphaproteobacteria bacterium]
MAKKDDDKRPIIIIKRVKKSGGGHHGGAWKVAYADFVTAMMAFFLLLWLLNVTTKDQRDAISSYFRPADPMISESTSGAGGVMGGQTMSEEGAMTDDKTPVSQQREPAEGVGREDGQDGIDPARITERELDQELDRRDTQAFKETEEKLREAIESVPDLKELAQNLLVDMTPEGLRIQIVDQEGKPMFELGSAKPMPQAEKLLRLITQVVRDLPNKLSVRGHTDSKPYGRDISYGNWELSADRANASRRVMLGSALDVQRIENIQGKADREHLVPTDPENARNRRISIILLKQSIAPATPRPQTKQPPKPAPKKDEPANRPREPGVIYFP